MGTDDPDTLTLSADGVQTGTGETIQLDTAVAALSVDGGAGADEITVSEFTASVTELALNGGAGNDQITVTEFTAPVEQLTLDGGEGSDVLDVLDVGSNLSSLTLDGGTGEGNDQYQVPSDLPPETQVEVQHMAPMVSSLSGPASGLRGQTLAFSGSFADPDAPDANTWTATVDYGDGSERSH